MKTKKRKLTALQKECLACERINLRRLVPLNAEDKRLEQQFWEERHAPRRHR